MTVAIESRPLPTPGLTARQLWEQLLDHTDLKISCDTVAEYYRKRRQHGTPGSQT